ncbi:DeoR/GlpR transcriptional regulator [Paenibacillus naphthalenovorans]|uniref:DeoR/GlpR family DNA-binding transcription regulator n=1 Tax=Paenibacillus naphthalenovorans TaxID=162209 RepID=UPI0010AF110B|nr:DeoR/GlpR family DNA-binding transcription regulator [Paenibacillus naphthalenovorans]GCL74290.1 DeoR/GlpR transcriptional regulator [Paenibacillus naphthalenovorans]
MLAEERYQRILQLIEQNRIVTVADIVNECRISDITARRDLVHLGRMNKITRIRGGAKAVESKTVPSDLNERFYRQALEHREEKRIIGGFAASLIEDGEIIILDGGSTTLEIAKQLVGKKDLTVIVTAINIAEELEFREGVTTILTGGTLRSRTNSLVNPLLKQTLSQIYADKVFIGVRGISVSHGYTTDDFAEAEVKKLLMTAAKSVYIVADSSKFNRIAAAQIGHIDEAHYIITEDQLRSMVKREFDHYKCRIIMATGGED